MSRRRKPQPRLPHVKVEVRVSSRARATWGFNGECYRTCRVEGDGSVLAWDEVAEAYSRHHDLTPEEEQAARDLAAEAVTRG